MIAGVQRRLSVNSVSALTWDESTRFLLTFDCNNGKVNLVDLVGIEPTTSSMPFRRTSIHHVSGIETHSHEKPRQQRFWFNRSDCEK